MNITGPIADDQELAMGGTIALLTSNWNAGTVERKMQPVANRALA